MANQVKYIIVLKYITTTANNIDFNTKNGMRNNVANNISSSNSNYINSNSLGFDTKISASDNLKKGLVYLNT